MGDPIELVLWLPTLCKKMDVPYCIVKGKSRLGQLVHQKNAAALCLTSVKSEDQREFGKIVEAARSSFNDGARGQWGGGILGAKNRHKMKVRAKILAKEMAQGPWWPKRRGLRSALYIGGLGEGRGLDGSWPPANIEGGEGTQRNRNPQGR